MYLQYVHKKFKIVKIKEITFIGFEDRSNVFKDGNNDQTCDGEELSLLSFRNNVLSWVNISIEDLDIFSSLFFDSRSEIKLGSGNGGVSISPVSSKFKCLTFCT